MLFLSIFGYIFLCALSIFGISRIPTHCLVTWPLSASGLYHIGHFFFAILFEFVTFQILGMLIHGSGTFFLLEIAVTIMFPGLLYLMLCYCFPTERLCLDAPFVPLKCLSPSPSPPPQKKKSLKCLDNAHHPNCYFLPVLNFSTMF